MASSHIDDAKYSVCIAGQGMDKGLQFSREKRREEEGGRRRERWHSPSHTDVLVPGVLVRSPADAVDKHDLHEGESLALDVHTEMERDTTEKEHRSVSARWMHGMGLSGDSIAWDV